MSGGSLPPPLPIKNRMKMDRTLRAEITGEVRTVLMEVLEGTREQWVSGEELSKQISCFTPAWLRLYGSSLPRTRAIVTKKDGTKSHSSYTYPLHRIQRMMMKNEMTNLKID